jgi:hypothetical protein
MDRKNQIYLLKRNREISQIAANQSAELEKLKESHAKNGTLNSGGYTRRLSENRKKRSNGGYGRIQDSPLPSLVSVLLQRILGDRRGEPCVRLENGNIAFSDRLLVVS